MSRAFVWIFSICLDQVCVSGFHVCMSKSIGVLLGGGYMCVSYLCLWLGEFNFAAEGVFLLFAHCSQLSVY